MSNDFQGVGNLGSVPTLSSVDVSGEKRQVANFRVYFDRQVSNGGEGYQDKGGFWMTVDVWGFRAEEALRLLKKGSRAFFDGTLREDSWNDESGEVRTSLRLTADYFAIDSLCIDSIQYKARASIAQHQNEKPVTE